MYQKSSLTPGGFFLHYSNETNSPPNGGLFVMVFYFTSPIYAPRSVATRNSGSLGSTYALDVWMPGICGSGTRSPVLKNSDNAIVLHSPFCMAVMTYVSLFSIARSAQSAMDAAIIRSVAVVSPARWKCWGNSARQ